MKIYTRKGDDGMTSFFDGQKVSKDDIRIDAYGDLDELNSLLGFTITHIESQDIKDFLIRIQHDIFTLCAELASLTTDNKKARLPKITNEHIKDLENMIDVIQSRLPVQKSFIIPGGTKESSLMHLARCITRRSERKIVTISKETTLNPNLLKYINRLSDLFYVVARILNKETQQEPIYKYFEKV